MIGLQGRGEAAVLRIRELLAEGYVGEVLSCNMTMFMPGILERGLDGPWRADREKGAHTLSIHAGHVLDVLCYCVGEFRELSAMATTQVREWETTEPGKPVKVTSPDNVLVIGPAGQRAPPPRFTWPRCPGWGPAGGWKSTAGRGLWWPSSPQMVMFGQVSLRGGQRKDGRLEELPIPGRLVRVPGEVPKREPFNVAQMYRRLGEAILGNGTSEPDFELALRRHRLLDAIQRSSDGGAKVPVP